MPTDSRQVRVKLEFVEYGRREAFGRCVGDHYPSWPVYVDFKECADDIDPGPALTIGTEVEGILGGWTARGWSLKRFRSVTPVPSVAPVPLRGEEAGLRRHDEGNEEILEEVLPGGLT